MFRHTIRTVAVLAAGVLLLAACSADGTRDDATGASGTAGGIRADAAALTLAQSGGSPGTPAPGITVVGTGRIAGEPDTLTTTVGVEVERDAVDDALTDANEAAQRVIDAVREAGVAEEDVQTREFSVQPRYDYPPQGQPILRGYAVTNLVEVKVGDLDRAGEVLTAATEAGGDDARVQGVQFALEDNDALLEQARARAFEDARLRAEQYARLAGRSLGPLVSLSEQLSTPPRVEQFEEGVAADSAARAVPIQPGQQEVQVQVTAIWSLA